LSVLLHYASTVPISSAEAMGWLRAGVGVALMAAPGAPMRLTGREAPGGVGLLLMRTIGIRDLVLAWARWPLRARARDADTSR